MKIAVATDGGAVCPHFGHAPAFTIYTAEGADAEKRILPNPGHEPGRLPALLHAEGVTCVIAGGMGPKAVALFCDAGIDVVMGVSGSADDAVLAYLNGTLEQGESMCHHPAGSDCSH
ncbi:MAG: dinitrogenase iron-molybdenum cofactor biosynthesis protein [Methanomicrobiales archaeon]|nr:dinitrogenase iron-molybdenum cofactor biosynthesis protein [Methanomicrobiales archaeon]